MDPRIDTLATINLGDIVKQDDPYYKFDTVETPLNLLITSAKDIVDNPSFWAELPESTRNIILASADVVINTLTQVRDNRTNADWLAGNYTAKVNEIQSSYNALYDPLVRGVREYVNATDTTKKAAKAALDSIRQAQKEANRDSRLISETATATGASTLGEYFETLVTGTPRRWKELNWWNLKKHIWRLQNLFSWEYAGHQGAARLWLIAVAGSIALTLYVAFVAFHGVNLTVVTLNEVLAKTLVLAAPAYAIRFSVRNFNANMHLAAVNRHRAVVTKTLLAFLARKEITDATREQIISRAAEFVFEPGETGYLTRRDGAGSADSVFDFSPAKGMSA